LTGEIFFPGYNPLLFISGKKKLVIVDEKLHLHGGGAEEAHGVAGDGRGGRLAAGPIRQDAAPHSEADGGHEDASEDEGGSQSVGTLAEKAAKVRVTITARRVRIDPEERRSKYIKRLEQLIEQLDAIISSSRTSQKLRLRAIDILRKTIDTCYGIVSDIEVEQLERELEEAKEEEGGDRELGYEVEEEASG